MKTLVINCFAGPGAGKTGCAWAIAAALKKQGKVVEYVSEVAKDLVWQERFDLLDGSLKNQKSLLRQQKQRIDDLIGKVEYVITDSPILLNATYLKDTKETVDKYEEAVADIFKRYNNFNIFIKRNESTFEQEGRIHNFEQSKKLDTQIKDMLERNDIYYGVYTHEKIGAIVNNIQVTHSKLDSNVIQAKRQTSTEENVMSRKRLFVDMDGVLAKFNQVDTMETLYEEGYFKNLEPMKNVIRAIRDVIESKQAEVFILSAVLEDSPYAKSEKNEWLDKYLPEIDEEHRLFPACGEDKRAYVPGGVKVTDYLLDDYTKNLKSWQKEGQAIKLMNGINHTKGSWEGAKTTAELPPSVIQKHIVGIMEQDELYQLGYYNMTEQQKIELYTNCLYIFDYGEGVSDSDGRLYEEIAEEQNKLYIQNLRLKSREAMSQGIYPEFKEGRLEFDTEFFSAQEISTLKSWHSLPSNYEMLDARNGVVAVRNKDNGIYSTFSQNADGNLSFENKFNSVMSTFADFQNRVDNMADYINSQATEFEI